MAVDTHAQSKKEIFLLGAVESAINQIVGSLFKRDPDPNKDSSKNLFLPNTSIGFAPT